MEPELGKMLGNITRVPLKPQQRMAVLKILLPKMDTPTGSGKDYFGDTTTYG